MLSLCERDGEGPTAYGPLVPWDPERDASCSSSSSHFKVAPCVALGAVARSSFLYALVGKREEDAASLCFEAIASRMQASLRSICPLASRALTRYVIDNDNHYRMERAMTLMDARLQDCVRIMTVDAGCGLRRRLEHIGLHPGDIVSVVARAAFRGPLLVEAHGMRLAVGRGVASRIIVTPIHPAPAPGETNS